MANRRALVAERTKVINRLRWHLHELDPSWQPPARSLSRAIHVNATAARLHDLSGLVARLSRELPQRCRELNTQITEMERELARLVDTLAPSLLTIRGCAVLTAAKILGETADIRRFRSRHAYARHNGTAPLPAWSGNQTRHRLSRIGNRQLTQLSTA
jgi:transposase